MSITPIVIPVDAKTADWPRKVATVLNRLQNTTTAAGTTAVWGSITGTLAAQTDLNTALSGKQPLDGDLTALAALSGTNTIYYRSGTSAWSAVTVGAGLSFSGGSLSASGGGTVTSVAASVPTGFSIAGSPVTTTGTLAITFTAGYSLPTDASQANWNTAFGWGNHASAGYLTTSAAAAAYQPLDGDLTALAAASGTNTIYYRSAANTWSAVTMGSGVGFSGGTLSATGTGGTVTSVSGTGTVNGLTLTGTVTGSGSLTLGGTLSVNTADLVNSAVTLAKIANAAANSKLLGSGASGSGAAYTELTLGTNLSMSGTTLNASGGGGGSFRGALVYKSADQTGLNFTTAAAVTWNSEDYDTDSIHDTTTNTSRMTVPSGVTKVKLKGQIGLNNMTSSKYAFLSLRKNGSQAYNGCPLIGDAANETFPIIQVAGPVLTVTTGDYFELFILIETDTSVDIVAAQSWFAMEIIA